jgi:hypothetical protein
LVRLATVLALVSCSTPTELLVRDVPPLGLLHHAADVGQQPPVGAPRTGGRTRREVIEQEGEDPAEDLRQRRGDDNLLGELHTLATELINDHSRERLAKINGESSSF